MKVASVFELKNVDENLFRLWVRTLPIGASYRLETNLWIRSKGWKTVVWTKEEGFYFY